MMTSINSLYPVLMIIPFFSCSVEKASKTITFGIFLENAELPYLTLKQSIKDSSPYRVVTSRYFDRNMDLQNVERAYFKIENGNVYKKNKDRLDLYLTINTDSCVFWEHHDPIMLDVASTHYCFTGRIHDFFLGGKKYASVFKFRKTTGIATRVVSSVITDENFHLVVEEFLEGYSNYYRIERRE